jgi:hypothetical protein
MMRTSKRIAMIITLSGVALATWMISNRPKARFVALAPLSVRADNERCSLASLQGTYAVHGQGTFLLQVPGFPGPPFPFGEAGIATFDGAGKLFGKTTVNAGGLVRSPSFTGIYTVSSDCTGSVAVQSNFGTIQENIVVIGGGQRYVGTETDPSAVIVRTVERLGRRD